MRIRDLLILLLCCPSAYAGAQSSPLIPAQVFVGYSYLSNSFNGVPGSHQPLNGFDASASFSEWHHLRFTLDGSVYRGSNLGNPQHAYFIMGGGQYGVNIHRERLYAEALVGEGGLNGSWYNSNISAYHNGNTGTIASLAEFLGGGLDTPLSSHTAFRVEGGVQHSNFVPIAPTAQGSRPFHLDGIPNYFGRFSAGIVWMPRPASAPPSTRTPVKSEIIFETINSFGHFKIFASSEWSNLHVGGIEYDRNSWGRILGARLDYSAELLPVVILRQPTQTDVWGNPVKAGRTGREIVPGLAVLPIGMRLMWLDDAHVKPYYEIKAGMVGYTKKAFSQYASYEVFALDQSLGVQFRLTGRTDFRAGIGVFHQSNGFVVPSNPGIDAMSWNGGISYHLGRSDAAY